MGIHQIITICNPYFLSKQSMHFLIIFIIAGWFIKSLINHKRVDWIQAIACLTLFIYLYFIFECAVLARVPRERQYQLELFWSWKEIVKPIGRIGATNTRDELILLNILNIFILLPSGMLIPIMRNKKMKAWQGLVIGIGISFVIEISQFAFSRGLFEIDDIIHNGIGCMMGVIFGNRILDIFNRILKVKKTLQKNLE